MGKKTAMCSGHVFYELENEPLPMTEEFALAEGEGPYEDWKSAHVRFFTSELENYGLEFS